MIKISSRDNIRCYSKYTLFTPNTAEKSFYICIGISLLDIIPYCDRDSSLRHKLAICIVNSIEYTAGSERNCAIVLEYLKGLDECNIIEDIQNNDFVDTIGCCFESLIDYFSNICKERDPILSLSIELGVLIEIITKRSVTIYGNQSSRIIKLFKIANHYQALIKKRNIMDELFDVISRMSNISDETKAKYNLMMQGNHINYIKSNQVFNIEQKENACNHQKQMYRTICGKFHCAFCLKDLLDSKTLEESYCTCNLHISPKNYCEIKKMFNTALEIPIIAIYSNKN